MSLMQHDGSRICGHLASCGHDVMLPCIAGIGNPTDEQVIEHCASAMCCGVIALACTNSSQALQAHPTQQVLLLDVNALRSTGLPRVATPEDCCIACQLDSHGAGLQETYVFS